MDTLSALVIAKPGQLRESLRVLLLGISEIGKVNLVEADQMNLAVRTEQRPALVLVDFEPGNETLQTIMHRIKEAWPGTLRIVLVDNEAEGRAATRSGSNLVLVKGLLASRLARSIEEALAQQAGPSSFQ